MPKSYEDLMAQTRSQVRFIRVPLTPELYALIAAKGRQLGARAGTRRIPATQVIRGLLEAALRPEAAVLRKL